MFEVSTSVATQQQITYVHQDCQIFLVQHTKTGKNIPKTVKFYKWPQNRPNGHNTCQHLPLQDPPKVWDFRFENMPSGNPDVHASIVFFSAKLEQLDNPRNYATTRHL
jgi:hypothetical protein